MRAMCVRASASLSLSLSLSLCVCVCDTSVTNVGKVEYGTATGPVDIIDLEAVKTNIESPQFQVPDQLLRCVLGRGFRSEALSHGV